MNHISVIVNDFLMEMEYRTNINEMTISLLESKIKDNESLDLETRVNIVKRLPEFSPEQQKKITSLLIQIKY